MLQIIAFAVSMVMVASDTTTTDFMKKIKYLESKLMRSTRQMMLQQFFAEETRRVDGSSGIKQVRYYNQAVKNYDTPSDTYRAAAAIHDHANNIRTVGMGEFVAVLNGVEFRTRHNDYRLNMPHRTSKEYHAFEPIPFPEVPPSVASQSTLDGQIEELHKWFKAWRDSDTSKHNYTKYFKPVLCYLEGGWTSTGKNIDEPFESDRHFIDADSWFDLQERVKYTSYTGKAESTPLTSLRLPLSPYKGSYLSYTEYEYHRILMLRWDERQCSHLSAAASRGEGDLTFNFT